MSKKYCIIFVALIMIFVSSCEFKANERKTTKSATKTDFVITVLENLSCEKIYAKNIKSISL